MNEIELSQKLPTNNLSVSGHGPVAPNFSLDDICKMAKWAAASRLFPGVATEHSAVVLMLLCQADGLHPIHALRRYHIIEGRPSMRADALQAEFQKDGGVIKILRLDSEAVSAEFSHPKFQPIPFVFTVTLKEFSDKGLTNKTNWRNYPVDMLWSRLITRAIRKIHPGIVVGIYSTEEVKDTLTLEETEEETGTETRTKQELSILEPRKAETSKEILLIGQNSPSPDPRPYSLVVIEAVAIFNQKTQISVAEEFHGELVEEVFTPIKPTEVHKALLFRAIQFGHDPGPVPSKMSEAVRRLTSVYESQRDWVRKEISDFFEKQSEKVGDAILNESEKRNERRAIEEEEAFYESKSEKENEQEAETES